MSINIIDAEFTGGDSAEEVRADWGFIETGIYDRPIEAAARAVSRDRGGAVEFEDMKQEAIVYAATRPHEMRKYHRPDGTVVEGKLYHRLYSRLLNLTRDDSERRDRTTSYEAALDFFGSEAGA